MLSESKTTKVKEIKDHHKEDIKMDILVTMIYTAVMTFIATKVIEHTPNSQKK